MVNSHPDKPQRLTLTTEERDLLIKCCNFVLAGEWPWEPEQEGERDLLQRVEAKLWGKGK